MNEAKRLKASGYKRGFPGFSKPFLRHQLPPEQVGTIEAVS